jgi:hypothetical protein
MGLYTIQIKNESNLQQIRNINGNELHTLVTLIRVMLSGNSNIRVPTKTSLCDCLEMLYILQGKGLYEHAHTSI